MPLIATSQALISTHERPTPSSRLRARSQQHRRSYVFDPELQKEEENDQKEDGATVFVFRTVAEEKDDEPEMRAGISWSSPKACPALGAGLVVSSIFAGVALHKFLVLLQAMSRAELERFIDRSSLAGDFQSPTTKVRHSFAGEEILELNEDFLESLWQHNPQHNRPRSEEETYRSGGITTLYSSGRLITEFVVVCLFRPRSNFPFIPSQMLLTSGSNYKGGV